MEANTRANLVEVLRRKDDCATEVPKDWQWVQAHKAEFLLTLEEDARYEHLAAGRCIKPCFNAMETSVVNTSESECMTNCIAKSFETKSLFNFLNVPR